MAKITHWSELLPEVGGPIIIQICRIKDTDAKISELISQIKNLENYKSEIDRIIEDRAITEWTPEEIRAAKLDFYRNHKDGAIQPIITEEMEYHILPDGRKVSIAPADVSFLLACRKLPATTRMELMHITDEEAYTFGKKNGNRSKKELFDLLNQKWCHREGGDLCEFTPDDCKHFFGLSQDKATLLKNIRLGKFTPAKMNEIKNYLNSNTELYIKDEGGNNE